MHVRRPAIYEHENMIDIFSVPKFQMNDFYI